MIRTVDAASLSNKGRRFSWEDEAMKARSAARWAWILLGATLASIATGVWLAWPSPGDVLAFAPTFAAFALVGAFLAAHRKGNRLGWLFLFMGTGAALGDLARRYALHASLPGRSWAAWAATWGIEITLPFLALLLLTFPQGRPPSPRWRWVGWLTVIVGAIGTLCSALADTNFSGNFPQLADPVRLLPVNVARPLYSSYQVAQLFLLAAAACAMVVRLRRSTGDERLQLKWFAFAGALLAGGLIVLALVPLGMQPVTAFVAFAPLLPVSAGIAILRYRLYDIDLIIHRTLVYGALTVLLGSAYVLIVAVAGAVLGGSELVTAGGTLAVAALFQPLRRRVQGFIDRSFYRRKYDAEKTLTDFSARLRDQIDPDTLNVELITMVTKTMQPSHVSLWLLNQPERVNDG